MIENGKSKSSWCGPDAKRFEWRAGIHTGNVVVRRKMREILLQFLEKQNVPHTPFIWVDHRFAKNICLQLLQPPNTTTITMCLDH